MDDEPYGKIRGFLAAMETLNNGQPETGDFVGFLFQRLPAAETPEKALIQYVYDEARGTFLGTGAPLPALERADDWRAAINAPTAELFYWHLPTVPTTVEAKWKHYSRRGWATEFVDLLATAFGEQAPHTWSVSWTYHDGRKSGSWFCHVRAYEFVLEAATGERFLLALGHDD